MIDDNDVEEAIHHRLTQAMRGGGDWGQTIRYLRGETQQEPQTEEVSVSSIPDFLP